jgi:hypothetical protein
MVSYTSSSINSDEESTIRRERRPFSRDRTPPSSGSQITPRLNIHGPEQLGFRDERNWRKEDTPSLAGDWLNALGDLYGEGQSDEVRYEEEMEQYKIHKRTPAALSDAEETTPLDLLCHTARGMRPRGQSVDSRASTGAPSTMYACANTSLTRGSHRRDDLTASRSLKQNTRGGKGRTETEIQSDNSTEDQPKKRGRKAHSREARQLRFFFC